ncbi:MAG: arginyltransferase [Phycisphaerae bacterium]
MSDPTSNNELISSPQADYDTLRNVTPEAPCPYLPARSSRNEAYSATQLDGASYECLLARGFRRSGHILFRPRCKGCQECRQLRVLVREFAPSKSMRRVSRRNADVRIDIGEPLPSALKYAMYRRYLDGQHDDTMSRSYQAFHDFLYDSPTHTLEFQYLLGERLVGVSVVDKCPEGLSSVYMYFDPDYRARSLGTYSILSEIDYCREHQLPYYYLGFYVAQSNTMAYKARFRPNQILVGADRWVSLRG